MSMSDPYQQRKAIPLSCDYLVIGAGATAMAFVDTLLSETKSKTVIMVDRRANPGGHWANVYSFVRLHQPAACYGVPSRILGNSKFCPDNLSSGAELQSYYKLVMDGFLATRRVRFLAKCDYRENGQIVSMVDPNRNYIVKSEKVVDSTLVKVEIPSCRPPLYKIEEGVLVKPLNDLVNITEPYDNYVVIGAGKTGIDACLWLLNNQVHHSRITWIISNDTWMINRDQFNKNTFLSHFMLNHLECVIKGKTVDEVFYNLEKANIMFRLDTNVVPTRYRCATVSKDELKQLRTLRNLVRQGRVLTLKKNKIILERVTISAKANVLYIDCTANGLPAHACVPIFQGNKIFLQTLRMCQPTYSASLIAAIEVRIQASEMKKNCLCLPLPHPNKPEDFLFIVYYTLLNILSNATNRSIMSFMWKCRLDWAYHFSFSTWVWGVWNWRKFQSTIEIFNKDVNSERLAKMPPSCNFRFLEVMIKENNMPLKSSGFIEAMSEKNNMPLKSSL